MPPEERAELQQDAMANSLYGPEPGKMPEPTGEAPPTGPQEAGEADGGTRSPAVPPLSEDEAGKQDTPKSEASSEEKPPEPESEEEQETQAQGQDEGEEEQQLEEGEEKPHEVQTLSELAEHLETDPDWLKGLKLTDKVRGEEVEFTLSDAIETYRKVASGDSYLQEAKERGAKMVEEMNHQHEQLSTAVAEFASMVEMLEGSMEADIKATNWDELRRKDPAEYAARKEDLKERKDALKALKARGVERYQQTLQTINEQRERARLEALPQEQEALLTRLPDWKDQQKAEKEVSEVLQYLQKDGFSEEDIKIASWNGRLMAMATKAYRYDRMKSNAPATKKKVTTIPKILKPGASKSTKSNSTTGKKTDRVDILYG